jgi:hypothetical protein
MFLTKTVTRKEVNVVTMSSSLPSDHDSENSTVLTRAVSSYLLLPSQCLNQSGNVIEAS